MYVFTVEGELIPQGIYLTTEFEDRAAIAEDMDWSTARVVNTQEVVNSAGETKTVERASGHFENGSVVLRGSTGQARDAKISVYIGERSVSSLDVWLDPGAVSFVFMENHGHLELIGASRKVRDPEKKFTIAGDFSAMASDMEGAVVRVRAGEYSGTGERVSLVFGRVVLDEGKFVIEAEVDEPRIVNILVAPFKGSVGQTQAIVEPGAKITVSAPTNSLNSMVATSAKGKHAQLIDSWQQSEEYVSTEQAYLVARKEYREKSESEESTESNTSSEDEAEEETPKFLEIRRELNRLRYGFLDEVASTAENPMDVLLALELGAHWGQEEGLPIYDSLAKSLDDDLVARRVTHARNNRATHIARTVNDRSLAVGKQAPDFTLPNFKGEEVSLSDLLEGKDFVLVDFWASWCGPCIATFPALKELFATYSELGFEIASVSIDDTHEAWSYSSEEHELPWVNLGELKGFDGEMVMSYGVNFVPKGYLLDSEGQIVQKDLTTDQLKAFLVDKYDEANEKITR